MFYESADPKLVLPLWEDQVSVLYDLVVDGVTDKKHYGTSEKRMQDIVSNNLSNVLDMTDKRAGA